MLQSSGSLTRGMEILDDLGDYVGAFMAYDSFRRGKFETLEEAADYKGVPAEDVYRLIELMTLNPDVEEAVSVFQRVGEIVREEAVPYPLDIIEVLQN